MAVREQVHEWVDRRRAWVLGEHNHVAVGRLLENLPDLFGLTNGRVLGKALGQFLDDLGPAFR